MPSSSNSKETHTALRRLFTKEQIEELDKDYFVSFNAGILSLGSKKIHITTIAPGENTPISLLGSCSDGIRPVAGKEYWKRKKSE